MSDPVVEIDIRAWVERARNDLATYRARQATEVVLNSIAQTEGLKQQLYLKGGVLMGLAYGSPRQTTDIDLTTSLEAGDEAAEVIAALLDAAFPRIVADLGYAGLVLKVHSVRRLPKGLFDTADFPALKLKVGYAAFGTPQHEALIQKKSANTVEVDISFNEPLNFIQVLAIPEGAELCAYSLCDLIAEKYRAMLQQVERRRNRRQDVYDLHILIQQLEIDDTLKQSILDSFLQKARSRRIEPNIDSLDNPEIRERSGADWDTMRLEIGDLPVFAECYERVRAFYRSLPWSLAP